MLTPTPNGFNTSPPPPMTPYMGTIGNAALPGQAGATRASRGHLIRGLMQELDRLSTVDTTAAGNAVVNNLTDLLLRDACRERATDIHLDPLRDGVHVRLRIDGKLLDTEVLGHEQG